MKIIKQQIEKLTIQTGSDYRSVDVAISYCDMRGYNIKSVNEVPLQDKSVLIAEMPLQDLITETVD